MLQQLLFLCQVSAVLDEHEEKIKGFGSKTHNLAIAPQPHSAVSQKKRAEFILVLVTLLTHPETHNSLIINQ